VMWIIDVVCIVKLWFPVLAQIVLAVLFIEALVSASVFRGVISGSGMVIMFCVHCVNVFYAKPKRGDGVKTGKS
jgi:hypothetical protein